jgi:adenosylcobyric acid synthase
MVQGTASDVGKSILTAALCRIFKQDGYSAAPFKSQNMALNSFITQDGLELGRAQAMQAEAAGLPPDVRMNPILLKPMRDDGSQVIVNGKPVGNMAAMDYYAYKDRLLQGVLDSYNSLAAEHDVIVIEGAGSPAEINLRRDDFVNMGLARLVNAPVLLAGDIDRGGVFASLYGTIKLLTPEDQAMIKGVIINKFRGDIEILRPGLRTLEELLGLPVLGVVPYARLDIDDEDSLAGHLERARGGGWLDIAVVRLPHLSNFTDFSPLERLGGVHLRYAAKPRELGRPDLVILPGSKNTMGDLLWLRQNGLEAVIKRYAEDGNPVFGVCGGYQMMGRRVSDPDGAEHGGELPGMGLLPIDTVFRGEKTTVQVSGVIEPLGGVFAGLSGLPVAGYEIHMGESALPPGGNPFASLTRSGEKIQDGAWAGNCAGSYLHGLFDGAETARALAECLAKRRGLDFSASAADTAAYKETQYDLLAETVRRSIDVRAVYGIAGL